MQPTVAPQTTSQGALTALQTAQSQAQDPNSYLTQQNQQLGVNDAQNTVTSLRGAIDNTTKLLQQVAPSIMGRTASSLVNASQAQRQIANEQAPIQSTLTDQGNQYNDANTNLSKLQDEAQTAAAGQYQGQQDKLSYLQNVYNSLYQQEQDAAKMAEQQREYNNPQPSASSSSSGIDPSIIAALLGQSGGYTTSKDSSGGTQFSNNGTPVTAATYYKAQAANPTQYEQAIGQFLASDPNSKTAYADFNSGKYTEAQLAAKYPYIFGTS